MDGAAIKRTLMEVVIEYDNIGPGYFQSVPVLREAARRLRISELEDEQALLTAFDDLFRQGLIGWGHDIANANPPFLHLTEAGHRALSNLSHDPYNPDGYLNKIKTIISENSISFSYIKEAVQTFQSNCFKATAVMAGVATEALILDLRDTIVGKMQSLNQPPSSNLTDWKIKTVRNEIDALLKNKKGIMEQRLYERFSAYWISLSEQIRLSRNDAGHPVDIEPVTSETVYASLLIFPEFAKLVNDLKGWVVASLT